MLTTLMQSRDTSCDCSIAMSHNSKTKALCALTPPQRHFVLWLLDKGSLSSHSFVLSLLCPLTPLSSHSFVLSLLCPLTPLSSHSSTKALCLLSLSSHSLCPLTPLFQSTTKLALFQCNVAQLKGGTTLMKCDSLIHSLIHVIASYPYACAYTLRLRACLLELILLQELQSNYWSHLHEASGA